MAGFADTCQVAICIPSSLREYRDNIESPGNRDLIQSQLASWPKYHNEIIKPLDKLIPAWEALGVRVGRAVTFKELGVMFADSRNANMVLISHSKENFIECSDGLVSIDRIVELVPPRFSGVIDLCVCRSRPLAALLRRERPMALTKMVDGEAAYTVWFYLYDVSFKVMANGQDNYIDALDSALEYLRG